MTTSPTSSASASAGLAFPPIQEKTQRSFASKEVSCIWTHLHLDLRELASLKPEGSFHLFFNRPVDIGVKSHYEPLQGTPFALKKVDVLSRNESICVSLPTAHIEKVFGVYVRPDSYEGFGFTVSLDVSNQKKLSGEALRVRSILTVRGFNPEDASKYTIKVRFNRQQPVDSTNAIAPISFDRTRNVRIPEEETKDGVDLDLHPKTVNICRTAFVSEENFAFTEYSE